MAECDWLPGLVYPFLAIFTRTKISTVETLMTVIFNWCTEWLMFIPNPPVTVLSRIDKIAKDMGGSAPLKVAWPALRSFFGEVAKTDSALILLDNILSSRPPFIEYLVASYAVLQNEREINSSNVRFIINRARKFYDLGFARNHNQAIFSPLPEGFYPILPIVQKSKMWKIKELQRIRTEAEDIKNEMELAKEIEHDKTMIERKRKGWMRQRTALIEIEAEQMKDFRRREKEMLIRENQKETLSIEQRKQQLQNREVQEENALIEWANESAVAKKELEDMTLMRKEAWTKWIELKEESARLSNQEVNVEMKLLNKRDDFQIEQLRNHKQTVDETTLAEQNVVGTAIKRNQELEQNVSDLLEVLERARRKHAQDFRQQQKKHFSNK